MYTYRYINKLTQFNSTGYSLILTDLSIPNTVRIEKNFILPDNKIDDEFLYQEALKEIQNQVQVDAQTAIDAAIASGLDQITLNTMVNNYITNYGTDSFISIILSL